MHCGVVLGGLLPVQLELLELSISCVCSALISSLSAVAEYLGVLGQGHMGIVVLLLCLGVAILVDALVVIVQLGRGVLLGVIVKPLELGLGLVPLQGLHIAAAKIIGLGEIEYL